eukprot:scaffold165673_cov83-Cyclotella_meneghiniana.AAC.1
MQQYCTGASDTEKSGVHVEQMLPNPENLELQLKSLVAAKDKMIESLTNVAGAKSLIVEADEKMDNCMDTVKDLGAKLNVDSYNMLKDND